MPSDEERISDLEHQVNFLSDEAIDLKKELDKAETDHDSVVDELAKEQDNSADLQKQIDELEEAEKLLRGSLESIQQDAKDALRQ